MLKYRFLTVLCLLTLLPFINAQKKILVLQSDFGVKDGAVAAMKGVAMEIASDLRIFDLTHEIPAYNIWEAGYRLEQTASYWPAGTVFVSVVDPGVGSERKSIVLKTKSGHYFVGPDNGQFTLIAQSLGIAEVREINEAVNRRKNSAASYTFHGRDVYAYTGAKLAAGKITLAQTGSKLAPRIVSIDYQLPEFSNGVLKGNIPILDIQYGNVWTNIDTTMTRKLHLQTGDTVQVTIFDADKQVYSGRMPFVETFSSVLVNQPLCYLNSLLNLSFAINQGDFSATYKISSGPDWKVEIRKGNE